MKATLTFTLPEDIAELKMALEAQDWVLVMWDLDQWLRGQVKYSTTDNAWDVDTLEAVREELHDILREWNLDMEVLP